MVTRGGKLVEIGRNVPTENKGKPEVRSGIVSTSRGTSAKFMGGYRVASKY